MVLDLTGPAYDMRATRQRVARAVGPTLSRRFIAELFLRVVHFAAIRALGLQRDSK